MGGVKAFSNNQNYFRLRNSFVKDISNFSFEILVCEIILTSRLPPRKKDILLPLSSMYINPSERIMSVDEYATDTTYFSLFFGNYPSFIIVTNFLKNFTY